MPHNVRPPCKISIVAVDLWVRPVKKLFWVSQARPENGRKKR